MRVGDIAYVNATLEYYGMAQPKRVDEMTDYEWAMKYAVLEDIRKREANQ